MKLHFRKLGAGHPLVILHGLYGASDNWYSIGRALSDTYEVYLVDLRNHGQSPHNPVHTYASMAEDVAGFFSHNHIGKAHIIGHSMGGKTGLSFALQHPDLIEKMIMVDISPCAYDPEAWPEADRHARIMQALIDLDLGSIHTREEADSVLEKSIRQAEIRMFLLKNLKRHTGGKFYWALNLPVLANSLMDILAGVVPCAGLEYEELPVFPLLFIKGSMSSYIDSNHMEAIHRIFPCSMIREIPDAGHWVHAEQPQVFLETVRSFLGN